MIGEREISRETMVLSNSNGMIADPIIVGAINPTDHNNRIIQIITHHKGKGKDLHHHKAELTDLHSSKAEKIKALKILTRTLTLIPIIQIETPITIGGQEEIIGIESKNSF
jgi:hypothetical protein